MDASKTVTGVDSMEFREFTYNYENGSFALPYRIYYPTDYRVSDKKYPLLFFLHGYGECGTDNTKQIRVLGGENALLDKVLAADNCVIAAPQCPADPAGYNWVPINKKWNVGTRGLSDKPTVSLAAATELLYSIIKSGRIDENRVYAAGISMGGLATWEIITRHPEIFAAAVPVCGSGIADSAEKIKNIAIWAFHGLADGTVPPQGTKDMENAIKDAGGTKMKATYFEGIGHNVWNAAYATEGLTEWLFAQSK